ELRELACMTARQESSSATEEPSLALRVRAFPNQPLRFRPHGPQQCSASPNTAARRPYATFPIQRHRSPSPGGPLCRMLEKIPPTASVGMVYDLLGSAER